MIDVHSIQVSELVRENRGLSEQNSQLMKRAAAAERRMKREEQKLQQREVRACMF